MKAIDQVIRDRVAPVLREAGFHRQRRTFWLETQAGDRAIVAVKPFSLGAREAEFFVDLAILPKVYWDWINRHGDPSGAPIGLWSDLLPAPGNHDSAWLRHWSFDLDDEQTGQQLTWRLQQVTPGLIRLLDPGNLVDYVRGPSTPAAELHLRQDAALALLLAEHGASAELHERLAMLEADGFYRDLVAYIRQRTATQ